MVAVRELPNPEPRIKAGSLSEIRQSFGKAQELQAELKAVNAHNEWMILRAMREIYRDPSVDALCLSCGSVFPRSNEKGCPECNDT